MTYEVIKDIKNNKWRIRRKDNKGKEIWRSEHSFSIYAQAARFCEEMGKQLEINQKEEK